jgi:hypothetical protein
VAAIAPAASCSPRPGLLATTCAPAPVAMATLSSCDPPSTTTTSCPATALSVPFKVAAALRTGTIIVSAESPFPSDASCAAMFLTGVSIARDYGGAVCQRQPESRQNDGIDVLALFNSLVRVRSRRGAVSNASGRFETETRVTRDEDFAFDDGWGGAEEASPTRTTVERDTSRTILARNTSPDIPFDRSINPYRGCEHGCF